jgi:hypothetical protein
MIAWASRYRFVLAAGAGDRWGVPGESKGFPCAQADSAPTIEAFGKPHHAALPRS